VLPEQPCAQHAVVAGAQQQAVGAVHRQARHRTLVGGQGCSNTRAEQGEVVNAGAACSTLVGGQGCSNTRAEERGGRKEVVGAGAVYRGEVVSGGAVCSTIVGEQDCSRQGGRPWVPGLSTMCAAAGVHERTA
jgi:hypothetical protein